MLDNDCRKYFYKQSWFDHYYKAIDGIGDCRIWFPEFWRCLYIATRAEGECRLRLCFWIFNMFLLQYTCWSSRIVPCKWSKQWVWREEIWQRSLVTKMVLFTQFYRTIAWDHNTGSDIHWLYFQNSLNIISSLTITNIIVLYMMHALTYEKWKSFDWAITIPYFNQKRRGDIAHLSEIGHNITNKRSLMVSNKQINISHCVSGCCTNN